jgi:hypothetical protein
VRGCIFILLLLSLFQPFRASAETVLTGTVVSVDPGKGVFALHCPNDEDMAQDIIVTIPAKYPEHTIKPGAVVRIRGDFSAESGGRFVPTQITREDPRRPFSDHTGVRKRLMRGRSQSSGRGRGFGGGRR